MLLNEHQPITATNVFDREPIMEGFEHVLVASEIEVERIMFMDLLGEFVDEYTVAS